MRKNNQFSSDDDGTRLERVRLLSQNIDTYAVEIDVSGDKLLRAQTAEEDWISTVATAGVEDGESQEATEELNKGLSDAHTYYVAAKEHLLSTIYDIEKPDEVIEQYHIKGDTPWSYDGLKLKIAKWLMAHNRLSAEGDPRVVSDAIIANLSGHLDAINDLWDNSERERRETSQAYAAKRELFDRQSKLLGFVFTSAKLVWGDNDPKLKDLGFVPKSEIWTPGQPEPPVVELPPWPGPMEIFTVKYLGASTVEVIYSGVQEVSFGDLSRRRPGTEDWVLVAENLPMAPEEIYPFREFSVPNGEWEYMLVPLRGNEKGIPSYATVSVVGAPR